MTSTLATRTIPPAVLEHLDDLEALEATAADGLDITARDVEAARDALARRPHQRHKEGSMPPGRRPGTASMHCRPRAR
jgi:hypothetical protein